MRSICYVNKFYCISSITKMAEKISNFSSISNASFPYNIQEMELANAKTYAAEVSFSYKLKH